MARWRLSALLKKTGHIYVLCFGAGASCRGNRLKKIDKYVELKHVNHCIAALTFDKDRAEDFFNILPNCSLF